MSLLVPTRRRFVTTTALAAAGTLAAPYVKTAHSAGTVSLGLWDHWVPGANDELRRVAEEWGAANNVEVTIDFITSIGNQHMLTAAAEARARTGHDIMVHPTWQVAVHHRVMEPIDDLVAELQATHGAYEPQAEYLAKHDGHWRAIVAPTGSHTYPLESRIDLFLEHAGIDLVDMFPAGERDPAKVALWTYDAKLEAARKLHAVGHPVGHPIGATSDTQDWLGPLFAAYGSYPTDAAGNPTIDSDATREAIEYVRRLAEVMPDDVYAWDDAANNRWLISGQGSSIFNPPSAWTVAVRDAPEIGAKIWHHDAPAGPRGRFRGSLPFFWGIWEFSPNKSAAKDLLLHLAAKPQVGRLLEASRGYDMPLQQAYWDHPVWEKESPPPGTLYNYPIRGDEELIVAGYPAPPAIGARIYNEGLLPVMIAMVTQGGHSVDDAIAWAEEEIEGYARG